MINSTVEGSVWQHSVMGMCSRLLSQDLRSVRLFRYLLDRLSPSSQPLATFSFQKIFLVFLPCSVELRKAFVVPIIEMKVDSRGNLPFFK